MSRFFTALFLGAFLSVLPACAQTSGDSPAPAAAFPSTPPLQPPPAELPIAGSKLAPKLAYSSVHAPGGKFIAMTFDDGPSAENTARLLDILAARKIKATFFLIGQNVAEYPKLVARELAEGHEVADHSWSHPQLSKMSDDAVRSQILRTQAEIEKACGYQTILLRPPYGAITARQKEWIHRELGMNVIMWSVDPLDWKYRNALHVQNEILKQVHPGAIVLSHDIHKTTVDAMPATLDALRARGYQFLTVSQLLALDQPLPTAAPTTSAAAKKASVSPPPSATP